MNSITSLYKLKKRERERERERVKEGKIQYYFTKINKLYIFLENAYFFAFPKREMAFVSVNHILLFIIIINKILHDFKPIFGVYDPRTFVVCAFICFLLGVLKCIILKSSCEVF